ncbi:hypothetical protein AXG93_3491s1210 [Marchantia polymorpha subsp. ruderalis]|uniref:Uncharacterized protein n=1 Tax=Marchantia polymorpha subsp. ruderalis TaxID=1480154 RepID=A0A176VN21_MARPO|nr:hypothetical protein AXG93_3491s1210 [Marchantia polymorpha subsp. ruderalis]
MSNVGAQESDQSDGTIVEDASINSSGRSRLPIGLLEPFCSDIQRRTAQHRSHTLSSQAKSRYRLGANVADPVVGYRGTTFANVVPSLYYVDLDRTADNSRSKLDSRHSALGCSNWEVRYWTKFSYLLNVPPFVTTSLMRFEASRSPSGARRCASPRAAVGHLSRREQMQIVSHNLADAIWCESSKLNTKFWNDC